MSCSIHSMLNLAVLTLGDSFLKVGPGKEARVDDLDDEVSMLLGNLVSSLRRRTCDVISSRSCMFWTGSSGCLGGVGREETIPYLRNLPSFVKEPPWASLRICEKWREQ